MHQRNTDFHCCIPPPPNVIEMEEEVESSSPNRPTRAAKRRLNVIDDEGQTHSHRGDLGCDEGQRGV